MLLSQLADDFYDHIIAERGGSENTVVAYRSTINQLLDFLDEQDVEPQFDQVTTALLRKFVVHLKDTGIRNSTVARHIHGLKSFWRYVVETYDLQRNATLPLKTPRVEHRIPDVLSEDECQRLLDACEENHFSLYRVRDRSIIKLMMILGLRRGEVIRLTTGDFDREQSTLKIVDAKNRKSRLLPVPKGVARDLKAWVEVRPSADHDHLFCSRQGNALNPRAIYRMMDRLVAAAGINGKNVHPHMLRHTAATMALRNSGDLLATQNLMGHSDPSVTRVYCHLTTDDIRRTVRGNPLSGAGQTREGADATAGVNLVGHERMGELDAHLGKTIRDYEALLDASPDVRDRWHRFWIADWCRHASAEKWPMSLPDAASVVWEDQPVQRVPISRLSSMHCLKDLLIQELQAPLQLPPDPTGWVADILSRPVNPSASPDRLPASGVAHSLPPIDHDQPVVAATSLMRWARSCNDRAGSVCADILVTLVLSRRHVFPVYAPRWLHELSPDHRACPAAALLECVQRTVVALHAMVSVDSQRQAQD